MFDRLLSWFGLARRAEVSKWMVVVGSRDERIEGLEGEVMSLTMKLADQQRVVDRLDGEVVFRRRFFDDTALANHDLQMIHAQMEGMLS